MPIRVAPLPGESLDSWLDALSVRLDATFRELTVALGLLSGVGRDGRNNRHRLLSCLSTAQISRLARLTGVTEIQVRDMTLAPFQPLFRRLDDRARITGMWRPLLGSRYCPACLAETKGRWQVRWRLPWTFACSHHRRMLEDFCPSCGRRPRVRGNNLRLVATPTSCPELLLDGECDPGRGRPTCGADLAHLAANRPSVDAELVAAQEAVVRLTALEGTATSIGVRLSASDVLVDVATIAGHALARADVSMVSRAADAASTGQAIADALAVVACPNPAEAARRLAPLVRDRPARRSGAYRRALPAPWRNASPEIQRAVLKNNDSHLRPADRLRFSTNAPGVRPTVPSSPSSGRHRFLPQLFWPGWSLRLMPTSGHQAKDYGAILAACTLLPGTRLTLAEAANRLGGVVTGPRVGHVLNALRAAGHAEALLRAVTELADRLDEGWSPIDYGRRREMFLARGVPLLGHQEWQRTYDEVGFRATAASRRHAQRYILEALTGQSPYHFPAPLCLVARNDTVSYRRFHERMTPSLAQRLRAHGSALLVEYGIAEPLDWEPPRDWVSVDLSLLGPEADEIDQDQLRELVVTQGLSLGHAAGQLGTTLAHVALVVRQRPLLSDPAGHTERKTPIRIDKHPRRNLLAVEHVRYRYEECGWSWRQIAREAGLDSPHTVRVIARQAGITSRPPGLHPKIDVDRAWLEVEYVHKRRTFPDIARELGASASAVGRAAQRFNISARPPGGGSRAVTLHPVIRDAPEWTLPALQGDYALQRIRRFLAVIGYPSLRQAAVALGWQESVLWHQIARLEDSLGVQLFIRTHESKGLTLTPHGERFAADIGAVITKYQGAT